MRKRPDGTDRPAATIAAELAAIVDSADRRSARLSMREEALMFRLQARRYQNASKLGDSIAKFGGGSLLTATLLLVVGGKAGLAIVTTAILTLLLFVAGTIFWIYCDYRAAKWEFDADWLEAVLKETEHRA